MTFRTALRLDAQQIRFTSLLGVMLTSIALIVLAQNHYKYAGSEAYSVGLSLAYNLIVYASFALFIPPIVKLTDRLQAGGQGARWFLQHLLISLSMVAVHMLFCNLLLYAVSLSSSPVFPRFITKYLTNVVQIHLLVYWAIVVLKAFNQKSGQSQETVQEQAKVSQWTQFNVNHKGRTLFISFDEVLWIEALDHYQKLHTEDGYYIIKSSMKQLETVLSSEVFQRAHRSYFVNLQKVASMSRNREGQRGLFIQLTNGPELRLGDAYAPRFKSL